MAESDADSGPSTAPDEALAEGGGPEDSPAEDAAPEPEPGRTELKVLRARQSLEEEAEAARRRVLGARRGRFRPTTPQGSAPDDGVDMSEHLRRLVEGVEEETSRLQEDVFRLRSAAGRAGATLQDEIQRAAEELAEQSTEELEADVGQAATESLAALTAAVDSLQETAARLEGAAGGLGASVERLASVAPVVEQLAQLAASPQEPSIPDALAGILRDLTDQLSALSDAVAAQVRDAVEATMTAELGRHEARIEHALARLVDELARLRRRLPVTKRGAAIDLSKEQLTRIGQAVGDYLLAAMREPKS
jgi:hypothetical protein